jgi:fucose 4-O-acetylase-like acetyltransferase
MFVKFGEVDYGLLLSNTLLYLQGHPLLNATVWFLVCLFTAEIWAVLFLSKVKTVLEGILIAAFFLYFGYLFTSIKGIEEYYLLPKNFWYFHESFIAFGFFTLGYATFPWFQKLVNVNLLIRITLIMIFGRILIWSVDLNIPYKGFAVIMKTSTHGNFYFFISAFSGILATILIASLIPKIKWVEYIGKNTLILLGTNGLFVSFFNSHIVSWLNHYENTNLVIFDSVWVSLLTIGISVPVIKILNRWLPQWVGRPQADGPLLKAISPPEFVFLKKTVQKISQGTGNIKE